jgi:hypothetical protein
VLVDEFAGRAQACAEAVDFASETSFHMVESDGGATQQSFSL